MRTVAAIIALLFLAACTTPEQAIKTQVVDVPVAVHCKPDVAPGVSWKDDAGVEHQGYPDTPENLKAASNIFVRVKLLLIARSMRIQRESELAAAVKGCE